MIKKENLDKIRGKKVLWIHAASVGEVNAVTPVIKEMSGIIRDYAVVLTTTSVNGRRKAMEKLSECTAFVCMMPFDIEPLTRRFVRRVKPSAAVLMETEIWPNMIFALGRKKVPVILINGRISQKSFGLYKMFGFFFSGLLNRFSLLIMQS